MRSESHSQKKETCIFYPLTWDFFIEVCHFDLLRLYVILISLPVKPASIQGTPHSQSVPGILQPALPVSRASGDPTATSSGDWPGLRADNSESVDGGDEGRPGVTLTIVSCIFCFAVRGAHVARSVWVSTKLLDLYIAHLLWSPWVRSNGRDG